MDAGAERLARPADPDAHAVGQVFGDEVFGTAVAGDRLHLEIDHHQRSVGAPVGCREVTKYAAADFAALGLDADGLGDLQVAVVLHPHVADEKKYALDRLRARERAEQEREREPQAFGHFHGSPRESEIFGACASSRSSSSKNAASTKPSGRAITTLGNDWIATFRSRADPL